ncbi:MAG: sigma 54-interacting transcriptional regulator [Proteobacteria bacterium]|nr:sigma 54-interacting transcriptional regulator [Pseudomonadota bacterium]MBU1710704.1 sigma 54-interacting transcriptional regulator [Pseudomonadota bacterium]
MPAKEKQSNPQAISAILKGMDFSGFVDSIPHGVLLLDSNLRVLAVNQVMEALTGYSRENAYGVRGEYIIRSSLGQEGDPVGEVYQSGVAVTIEADIINRNRKKKPVRFTISPLKRASGEIAGVVVCLEDISLLKDRVHGFSKSEKIIGHSRKMQEIFELLPIIARTDASALLTGETGTGKDLFAEAIHLASKRSPQPFIKINCGALPEALLESELFGHVRGAFTGADRDKPGMFRLAHGGTIFLTEIGDLPLPLQVKLLTVLDDKEFFPVGGSKKVCVDVRIIAATHRDLREFVRLGKFREDLFYRLNVLHLHIPPLREREDDFRLLVDHFLREFSGKLNKDIKGFNVSCFERLSSYSFPGNVRELRNIVEYAVNICQSRTIEPAHLPNYIFSEELQVSEEANSKTSEGAKFEGEAKPVGGFRASGPLAWNEMEKQMIIDALVKTGGRRIEAAKILGWGRSTLWRKLKHHALA